MKEKQPISDTLPTTTPTTEPAPQQTYEYKLFNSTDFMCELPLHGEVYHLAPKVGSVVILDCELTDDLPDGVFIMDKPPEKAPYEDKNFRPDTSKSPTSAVKLI